MTQGNKKPRSAHDAHMTTDRNEKLADYGERLRRLHNKVRPLLPEAQQDELLELAIGVSLMAVDDTSTYFVRASHLCQCGHPQAQHRNDPVLCLDCWHSGGGQDCTRHEHLFQPARQAV